MRAIPARLLSSSRLSSVGSRRSYRLPSRCASACMPVLSWATNKEHETAGLVAQVLDASSVTRPAHLEQPGYTTVGLRQGSASRSLAMVSSSGRAPAAG